MINKDTSITDIKELFDKMGIEMTDETTQALTKLSKEWDNLPFLVIANFNSLKNAVVSCISPKEEEVILTGKEAAVAKKLIK